VRADAALADRYEAVRTAARGWRKTRAIDEATLASVEAAYPDDRARLGPMFRTLAFLFTFLAAHAFFGVAMLIFEPRGDAVGVLCLLFGIGLAVVTEGLTGPLKRADSGMEAATALVGFTYGTIGLVWTLSDTFDLRNERAFELALIVVLVLCAAGFVRWGFIFFALFAPIAFFLLLARLPAGRALWIATAVVLAVPLARAAESARLAPSHRRGALLTSGLAILALYVAVHLGSWDHKVIEWMADFSEPRGEWSHSLRVLSIVATAALPLLVLAFGVITRRGYLIDLGILLDVASLVTLRFYVHVAPVWVVLTVSGTIALLATLALRRFLASGPAGERGGLTAAPLFEDLQARQAMEMMAAATSLAPAARPLPAEAGGLEPGGGRFGGGGASGDY
jgi:hypothetical protein